MPDRRRGARSLALPVVVVAILLGRAANRRMSGPAFIRFVQGGLIVVGLLLLVQSASSR